MKKIFLFIIMVFAGFVGLSQQYVMTSKGYTINGLVEKGSGYVTLRRYLRDGNELYDSARMDKKGRFVFRGYTEVNIPALITVNGKKEYRVYLEPSMNMELAINNKKETPKIKNGNETMRWYSIITPERQEDNGVYLARLENWALNHPEDIFSSDIMASYLSYYWSFDELQRHLNVLKGEGSKTYHYIHLRNRQKDLKDIAVGKKCPEIALKDIKGKKVSLNSLTRNKKYVLLDFWASWSEKYKDNVPNLLTIYKNYYKKGFDIYSVSLDKSETDWKKAIEDYNMSWTNVCDLKMWESHAVEDYMVKSVPYNVLIDNKGMIVAQNLTMEQLNTLLSSRLDHQSYNIAGNIKGITEGTARLELLLEGGKKKNYSTRINNGNFAFTGEVEKTCMAMIDLPVKDGTISFFMGNDNINISGEARHLEQVKIKGSASQDGFLNIASTCNNQTNPMQCLMKYVNDNPSSIYSPFILSNYLYPYLEEKDRNEAVNNLYGDAKTMFQYTLLKQQQAEENSSKDIYSDKAKDFTILNLDNKEIELYNEIMFYKYTLVTFWASWDNMSRIKNLEYLKLYNNYAKKDKFNIISVSLDDNKYSWQQAVNEDGMNKWENVSDLKRWSSSVVRLYDLKSIPYNMLLDKNGNILGKNLTTDEIISIIIK